MLFKRVNTDLIFNVTNPELIPLYEGNEAYELIKDEPKAEETKETKKATKKK